MKKYLFLLAFAGLTLYFGCTPENNGNPVGENPTVNTVFNPCSEEVEITLSDLPDAIVNYLNDNYPNGSIDDLDQYIHNGNPQFGVEIDQPGPDLEILFSAEGDVLGMGDDTDDQPVPVADLPQPIIDYLSQEYPNADITSATLETDYGFVFYEIYLNNDVELYFNEEGELVCVDDNGDDDDGDDDDGDDDDGDDDDGDDDDGDDDDGDDDDGDDDDGDDDDGDDDDGDDDDGDDDDGDDDDGDDDDGDDDDGDDDDGDDDDDDDNVNLPEAAVVYINANYPGYQITDAELEDYCDQNVIEVELEDGPGPDLDLYFSLNGNFILAAFDTSPDDLPAAVLNTLAQQFPNYEIESDDVERYEMADGSIQYEVYLETDDDDDELEVVLTEAGDIVCIDD